MPDTRPQNSTVFEENIGVLQDEINLAAQWGRPSILLAVNKSKFGEAKAVRALESQLKKRGQNVVHIVVNNDRADVPHLIQASPAPADTVFFVSNLDWGGGLDGKDAYRALNLYRELFIENRIKVVFWLTTKEAARVARHAPDFWAFRHHFIEFASPRAAIASRLPAGVLLWGLQSSVDTFDSLDERIRAREGILAKLPQNMESLSTRLDLFYNLGYLYWQLGDTSKASQALRAGLDLTGDLPLPDIRSRLLSGMGVMQYESKDYSLAIENFKAALEQTPTSSSLMVNLSAACCMLGRNQEAGTIGKRALRGSSEEALIWNRMGYIYTAMGKLDEAIECMLRATQLAPRSPAYHESVAVVYSVVERRDKSQHHIDLARQLAGDEPPVWIEVYTEAINGNEENACQLLEAAIRAGQISRPEARRDPSLSILLDAAQLDALTG